MPQRRVRTSRPLNLAHGLHDNLIASWRPWAWRSGGSVVPEELLVRDAALQPHATWSPAPSEPPGPIGSSSIACDGSATSGMVVANYSGLGQTTFSLSGWFLRNNTTNYECVAVLGNGDGANRDLGLFLPSGSTSQAYYAAFGSNVGPVALSPGYTLGAWTHMMLTCAYNGSTCVVNIYVNGVNAYTNPTMATGTRTTNYFSIGNELGSGGQSHYPLNGHIGAIDLWGGRAFDAGSVKDYYDRVVNDYDLFNYHL